MQPQSRANDIIFYDGTCGLCHGFVQWTLARDHGGVFCFASLQGETFRNSISDEIRSGLPDSVVVQTNDCRLLVRSDAAIYVAQKLGAASFLTSIIKILPRGLRDALYNFI